MAIAAYVLALTAVVELAVLSWAVFAPLLACALGFPTTLKAWIALYDPAASNAVNAAIAPGIQIHLAMQTLMHMMMGTLLACTPAHLRPCSLLPHHLLLYLLSVCT